MTELWNAALNLNWPVLAVLLAVVIPVAILVIAGLVALGLYLITRVPPIRWVCVTLLDAATLPARRWTENTIDAKLDPLNDLDQILAEQGRMVAQLQRTEAKAEEAHELAQSADVLAREAHSAAARLQRDVDDLTLKIDNPATPGK